MEIGNSLEDLYVKHFGLIKILRNGKSDVNFFNSNGQLNAKIKNIVNEGEPSSNSNNGIYCDDDDVYFKTGNVTINVSSKKDIFPSGSIIMFHGNTSPDDWNLYGLTPKILNTVYITNR